MITARGDALVERIQQGGTADDAHKLIAEFSAGYPVTNLRQLLHSERDDAVKTAVWIASELGERVAPLLGDISGLLHHKLHYVRALALDAILLAASPANGDLIADAVRSIDDEDDAVRWKAMHFLSKATAHQLRASVRHMKDFRLAALLRWLLDVSSDSRSADIIDGIDDALPSKRLFAAAAAARVADETLVPLRHATASVDKEISSFAREWLENPKSAS